MDKQRFSYFVSEQSSKNEFLISFTSRLAMRGAIMFWSQPMNHRRAQIDDIFPHLRGIKGWSTSTLFQFDSITPHGKTVNLVSLHHLATAARFQSCRSNTFHTCSYSSVLTTAATSFLSLFFWCSLSHFFCSLCFFRHTLRRKKKVVEWHFLRTTIATDFFPARLDRMEAASRKNDRHISRSRTRYSHSHFLRSAGK